MKLNSVDLAVGASITLDIRFTRRGARHVAKNVEVVLAGIEHGQFLLVRLPEKTMSAIGQHLQRGATAVAKYLKENRSCSFEAAVVGTTSEVAPMLWLGYPVEVTSFPLRKEPRVACTPQALVKIANKRFEGTVADISGSGCRIMLSPKVESDPEVLAVEATVQVRFQLPGQPDPISAFAEVRWLKADVIPWALGLSFTMMDEESQQKIQKFLGAALFYG